MLSSINTFVHEDHNSTEVGVLSGETIDSLIESIFKYTNSSEIRSKDFFKYRLGMYTDKVDPEVKTQYKCPLLYNLVLFIDSQENGKDIMATVPEFVLRDRLRPEYVNALCLAAKYLERSNEIITNSGDSDLIRSLSWIGRLTNQVVPVASAASNLDFAGVRKWVRHVLHQLMINVMLDFGFE